MNYDITEEDYYDRYDESIDLANDFQHKMKWMKNGFLWCYSLTNRQRKVIYLRLFMKKNFEDIGIILNIDTQTARNHWSKSIKSLVDKNLLFDE